MTGKASQIPVTPSSQDSRRTRMAIPTPGGDDVGPGKEEPPEIDPQAVYRQPGQLRVAVPVEESRQRLRPKLGDEGQRQPHQTGYQQGQTAELADGMPISPTVGLADEGLGALGQAGEQCQGHQGQIGHDAVGRHTKGAGSPEHQGVVEGQYHAGGKLIEKGGAAQTGCVGQGPGHLCRAGQAELAAAGEDVKGAETQTDHRGDAGGQSRTEDAHVERIEEEVVKGNVGQTAGKHGGHGQLWIAVVADKAHHYMIEQETGGEEKHRAQIDGAQGQGIGVASQHQGKGSGAEAAQQR